MKKQKLEILIVIFIFGGKGKMEVRPITGNLFLAEMHGPMIKLQMNITCISLPENNLI